MLFNTFEFFIFFVVVFTLYYTIQVRFVVLFLLLASCVFYSYFIPVYLLVLLAVILIDFFSARWMEQQPQRRRLYLVLSICSNLGILFFFKYYNFAVTEINSLFDTNWVLTHLILPVGLSFHTFQSLSYVLEVYHGRYPAEKRFSVFALYVMYFPQLVAGPIEPPQNLLHQFTQKRIFLWDNVLNGLRLVCWGLFKKAVIADRISFYVAGVFDAPAQYNSWQVLLGVVFFTIQIYCDFSGYSDMAVGLSRCLNIKLTNNFQRPFFASNIKVFWRRWHVTLSDWFKNYVYIPLGGNRQLLFVNHAAIILLVFFLSGIWHGAGFNYILWGVSNGLLIILYLICKNYFRGLYSAVTILPLLNVFFTCCFVMATFVFFRAKNLEQAAAVFNKLIHFSGSFDLGGNFQRFAFGTMNLLYIFAAILLMVWVEKKTDPGLLILQQKPVTDIFFFIVTVSLIVFTGVFYKQSFIYFQF
jgi:alginate O-acetyltransferase complex protein AlgI